MLIRDYSRLDLTNPVADVPLNVGLVGWWLGLPNVSGGNRLWDIAGFTHGTIVNFNPSIWRRTQRGFGALDYNGTNQSVNLSTSSKLSITGSFTYTAWINADVAFSTTQSIMGRFAGSGARGPYLRGTDSSGNKIQMFVTPDGSTLVNRLSSSNITVGQDAFVAGVYNSVAQTLDVYINGVLSNGTLSGTVPSSVSNPSGTDFKFGIRSDDSDPFNGRIDDIRIYNRAITASEMWLLYQHGLRGYCTPDSPLRWRRRTFLVPEQAAGGPTYTLTCATGNFTLTGNATSLQVARKLPTAVANFTLTGNAVNLVYTPTGGPTYTLTCSTGNFALTGMNVGFIASRKLATQAASYTLTGNAAGLAVGRKLATQAGSFTLTGNATTLQVARKLVTQAANFVLTGIAVGLTYSGAPTFVNKILTTSTIGRVIRTTSNIARKVRT